MLKLIHVIEINPVKYCKKDYEIPEIQDSFTSEDLHERWKNAISTLDLDLKPVQEGSYFVDTETLNDKDLKIILKIIFDEIEIEEPYLLSYFDGGLILKDNDKILLEPTCCTDLEHFKEWQYLFQDSSSEWSQLWIGHPWVFYRKESGKIHFSDYTEDMLSELQHVQGIFAVDESSLKTEINKMEKQQIYFKKRVIRLLKEMGS